MNEPPPAELLRRLRPIPTYGSHPTTTPHDVAGVDPAGTACTIELTGPVSPALLLFLSSDCLGCRDLWEGADALAALLPDAVRVVVISRGPEREDAAAIAALAPAGVPTVMSTEAFTAYRVQGAPFLVVVEGDVVLTEGVAWGVEETARTVRVALGGDSA